MKTVRQGDVLLRRVDVKPTGQRCDEAGRIILAHGEVTGHAHEVIAVGAVSAPTVTGAPARLFQEPDGARLLVVDAPCALVHQEHGTVLLQPGSYYVIRQREYSPVEIRNVAD